MNRRSVITLAWVALLAPGPLRAESASVANSADIQAAQSAIARMSESLKNELQAAMKSGGPFEAVSVCHVKAPTITSNVGKESLLEISRVSSRTRNPHNAPDAQQARVLDDFEALAEKDTPLSELNWSHSNGDEFIYMQAIAVAPICLQCHGKQVDAELLKHIQSLYPEDRATGYQTGELRGAFVVKGPVSNP